MPKIFRANGTIRTSRFVKIDPSDNNSILEADANQAVIGISQIGGRTPPIPDVTTDPPEAAQAGENVNVFCIGEDCLLYLGTGGVAAAGELKSDANGAGVAVATSGTTIQEVGAIATETASAAEYARVQVVRYPRRPALS